jgi:hypothetical protein
MIRGFQTDLAYYKPLQEWAPAVGDIIIQHGWFTHWFGVISQINTDGTIDVIRAGLPVLLVTMSTAKMQKSKKILDTSDIKASSGGRFAAIKCAQNALIWYV